MRTLEEARGVHAVTALGRPAVHAAEDLRPELHLELATRMEELATEGRRELQVEVGALRAAAGRSVHFETRAEFQKWAANEYVDFLEIFSGHGELTIRARELGLTVGEGIDRLNQSYGKAWALETSEDRRGLAWLICYGLKPRGTAHRNSVYEHVPDR